MLVKLLKYDIKNLGITIFPMYLCLVVFAVFDRIIQLLKKTDALSGIKAVGYMANFTQLFLVIGLSLLPLMVLVIGVNYYKDNIMRDEGYLMHTLPVNAYQLVASKLLSFLGYVIFSVIVCYFILALDYGDIRWYQKAHTNFLAFMSPSDALIFCVNMGVYMFIYMAFGILVGYLAINIGYSVNGRMRSIAVVAVIILFVIIGKCGELLALYFLARAGYTDMDMATVPLEVFQIFFVSISSLYAVLSVLCYALAGRWLSHHLNLD